MIAIDSKGDCISGKTKKKMNVTNLTDTLTCRAKRWGALTCSLNGHGICFM